MTLPETAETARTASDTVPPQSGARTVDWSKPRVAAILGAAARCFARSGFETTTAEIAKELGVPKSIIYHYFENKNALIQEVQRYAYQQHLARVAEVLGHASAAGAARVADILRMLWGAKNTRNVAFDIGVWSALRNDAVLRRQAIELQREHRRLVGENVARALGLDESERERTEPLTTLIVAALTGLSIHAYVEGDDSSSEQAHELFLQLLDRGIDQFKRRRDSDLPPDGPDILSEHPPAGDGIEEVRIPASY